jgi:DNA repair protein RecO (recombination protein O)
VVCAGCARGLSGSARRLLPASIAALGRLQGPAGGPLDERFLGDDGAGPFPAGVGVEIRDALTSFIEHQLGRRLASRKFLDEVGPVL